MGILRVGVLELGMNKIGEKGWVPGEKTRI